MLARKKDSATGVPVSETPTLAPSNASVSSQNHNDTNKTKTNDVAVDAQSPQDATNSVIAEKAAAEDSQDDKDTPNYPGPFVFSMIMLALSLAVLLMALDNSIIATAIPEITNEFNSLNDVGWYGSAYLLTTAALQLFFGKLYKYFNIKWVFLAAVFTFEVGSLICGAAPSSIVLILGRAIAGIGGAGMFSGALIILAYSLPLEKRPLFTGLLGSMYGLASVCGPLLGGVFTDKVTWRWCFYINLPIGAITIAVIAFLFPNPHNGANFEHSSFRKRIMTFDPIGTSLFMPAVICLLLILHWGGHIYAWNSARIIVLFVLFGLLILSFLFVQWKMQENATVPPRILMNRSVAAGAWYSFSICGSYLVLVYFLPIWFQAVKGASAIRSGVMNLPMLVSFIIASTLAGGIVSKFGYYTPFMIIGTVLASIGLGLITTFEISSGSGVWIGYQILLGAGVGLGFQQPMIAAQTVLKLDDVSIGTSLMAFSNTLGGAIFVSVAQNLFSNELVSSLKKHVPHLDADEIVAIGATAIKNRVGGDDLIGVRLAYNDGLVRAFIVGLALGVATVIGCIFMEWKSVKGKAVQADHA